MAESAQPRPAHVGILAMEAYFPSRFVSQADLEEADECKGKYTAGLGQSKVAFVDDRCVRHLRLGVMGGCHPQ
jgi:hydroxymethylglutaryl-CoA synthase